MKALNNYIAEKLKINKNSYTESRKINKAAQIIKNYLEDRSYFDENKKLDAFNITWSSFISDKEKETNGNLYIILKLPAKSNASFLIKIIAKNLYKELSQEFGEHENEYEIIDNQIFFNIS